MQPAAEIPHKDKKDPFKSSFHVSLDTQRAHTLK